MAFSSLSSIGVRIFSRFAALNAWPVAMVGQDSDGNPIPIMVDSTGAIVVSTGGGGQVVSRPDITTTSGAGATSLDSIVTVGVNTGYVVLTAIPAQINWRLTASTASTDATHQRPLDYNAVTNPKVWEQF